MKGALISSNLNKNIDVLLGKYVSKYLPDFSHMELSTLVALSETHLTVVRHPGAIIASDDTLAGAVDHGAYRTFVCFLLHRCTHKGCHFVIPCLAQLPLSHTVGRRQWNIVIYRDMLHARAGHCVFRGGRQGRSSSWGEGYFLGLADTQLHLLGAPAGPKHNNIACVLFTCYLEL